MRLPSLEYAKEKWQHAGFQKYLKNTSWMFLGQATMLISLIVNIWLARYLGPENFGTMSYVFAFAGILGFLSNLGINDILIRELVKYPEKKDRLLGTAFAIMSAGSVLAFALTAIGSFLFETNPIVRTLIILYSTTNLLSPVNVISAYFQATVQARKNALAQIIGTICVSLVKILLILTGKGIIWLTFTFVLDYLVGAALYLYNYRTSGFRVTSWKIDGAYARMLIFASPLLALSSAAGYLLIKIDQVMIKFFLDETAVGLYAVAVRLSELWYFIPGIVCASVFPALVNARETNRVSYGKRLRGLFLLLGISATLIALPVSALAPWIIRLLYGSQYAASVPLLQIYIWSGIGLFLSTGLNRLLITEHRLKSIFAYNLGAAILNVILNLILIPRIGLSGAAWATLISYLSVPAIAYCLHIIKKDEEK